MVFGPKSIGKPLLPMVLDTKNHRKTIDINGEQRCMCIAQVARYQTANHRQLDFRRRREKYLTCILVHQHSFYIEINSQS